MDAIKWMDLETLQKFIPKLGDRLAIIDFGNRSLPTKRNDSLLEKLRLKLKKTKGVVEMQGNTVKTNKSRKSTRIVEIGWLHFDNGRLIQIRTKQGGGTRKISVKQECTQQDLLSLAKNLFFVDGVSTKGHSSQFDFTLSDFKCQEISQEITVAELFEKTGITRLRFYLTSRCKDKPATSLERTNIASYSNDSSNEFPIDKPKDGEYDSIIAKAIKRSELNLPSASDSSDDDYEVNNNLSANSPQSDHLSSYLETEFVDIDDIDIDLPESEIYEEPNTTTNFNKHFMLILHRGNVLDELMDQFMNIEINSILEIEIYLPNGEKEKAQNIGGVFRDILSEFWQDFFNRYTIGSYAKVPVIRHDFDDKKWLSVGKILLKGWMDERYYPVQFSRTFMERCIFGKSIADLTDDFFKYVSDMDSRLMKAAIEKFDDVNIDELLECLDNLECKWKPSRENIKRLVNDLAHKELIQKPMFIIDCWSTILGGMMSEEDISRKYDDHRNLPRNILKKLEFDENLNTAQQTISNYLKKFLRESEEKMLCDFLRFVTGANLLIEESTIKISFACDKSISMRTPTAHTCSCLLI